MAMDWLVACSVARAIKGDEPLDVEDEAVETAESAAVNQANASSSLLLLADNRPKCIDLFSGVGGFTLGMALGGYNVVGHVEFDKIALKTYELNAPHCGFSNSELIGRDITKISDEQILAFGRKHGKLHSIVGGPPCQGFSTSGKRDPKDPRNSLFIHFVRFVRLLQPSHFLMENVPGMRNMKTASGENCLEIIVRAFREVGYKVDWRILNAANYGVPQTRRRIFIMGNNNDEINRFPFPTHWGEGEGMN